MINTVHFRGRVGLNKKKDVLDQLPMFSLSFCSFFPCWLSPSWKWAASWPSLLGSSHAIPCSPFLLGKVQFVHSLLQSISRQSHKTNITTRSDQDFYEIQKTEWEKKRKEGKKKWKTHKCLHQVFSSWLFWMEDEEFIVSRHVSIAW